MQLLDFVMLLTVVMMELVSNTHTKFFIAGFGFVLMMVSKVQGWSFVFFILLVVYLQHYDVKETINKLFFCVLGACASALFIIVILVSLDGWEVISKLVALYFDSNVAEAQFKGRGAGDIPPFYKFIYEPTFFIALLAVIYSIFTRKKVVLSLSLVALIQLGGLFLIYLVTARGGPVISNYVLDFQVLGLVVVSALFGMVFGDAKFKLISTNTVLVISVMSFVLLLFIVDIPHGYSPNVDNLKGPFFWGLVLILLYLLNSKVSNNLIYFFVLLVVGIVIVGGVRGVEYSKSKKSFAVPYHNTAKLLASFNILDRKPVWVSVILNRSTATDGSRRLKRIYQNFYQNEGTKFIFSGNKISDDMSYVVTDRMSLLADELGDGVLLNLGINFPQEGLFITDINKQTDLSFRLGGSRGEGSFNVEESHGHPYLYFEAGDETSQTVLQVDISNHSVNYSGKLIFLQPTHSSNKIIPSLFVQYRLNDKYHRSISIKGERAQPVSLSIPLNATEVSFGYYYKGSLKGECLYFEPVSVVLNDNKIFQNKNIFILKSDNS